MFSEFTEYQPVEPDGRARHGLCKGGKVRAGAARRLTGASRPLDALK